MIKTSKESGPKYLHTLVYNRGGPKKFYLLIGCSLPSSTTKKIFLAFEGHKGRKAKKGQIFPKNKYGSKCLKLPNSARNPIKNFSPL